MQQVTATHKEESAELDPAIDSPSSPTLDVNLFLSSFLLLQDSLQP